VDGSIQACRGDALLQYFFDFAIESGGRVVMKESFSFQKIPVSTYRIQFNYLFGFVDAAEVVPYLRELGITDVYAAPYFKARRGSVHGYDIIDPNMLNPEVGTEEEYHVLTKRMKNYGMG
jgi:(1->4)-alpha-D-glucan 1-alpha-D-glucosylmutase